MKNKPSMLVSVVLAVLLSSLAFNSPLNTFFMAEATSLTRYVAPDGRTTGDCLSWEKACDLQYTLGVAESGDQIWVMEGIYYPGSVVTDTFQLKDGIALYGGFPSGGGDWDQRDWYTYPTILSGDIDQNDLKVDCVAMDAGAIKGTNAYHVITITDQTSIKLDGIIITAGSASGSAEPFNYGGGLYNNSGTIELNNVTISGNKAFVGGGIYNKNGTAILKGITFNCNQASWMLGGLANGGIVKISDAVFSGNHGDQGGGGMGNGGTAILYNITFSENSGVGLINTGYAVLWNVTFSSNWGPPDMGGGMWNANDGTAVLNKVDFTDNFGSDGGGMTNNWGTAKLTNVSFSGNTATSRGGGLFNADHATLTNVIFSNNQAYEGGGVSNWAQNNPVFTNVTFSANTAEVGAGLYNFESSPTLINVTFLGNLATKNGGGISNIEYNGIGSHPILVNTIMWENSPNQIFSDGLSSAVISYSDIQGGWVGTGNINVDPLLGSLDNNGGLTLTHALKEGSPAIDVGSPTNCPPWDQRGFFRPIDGDGNGIAECDMGAFEYGSFPPDLSYLPQVMD